MKVPASNERPANNTICKLAMLERSWAETYMAQTIIVEIKLTYLFLT
jgi:hypothetical protein